MAILWGHRLEKTQVTNSKSPQALAGSISANFLHDNGWTDLDKLCESEGIVVSYVAMDPELSGWLEYLSGNWHVGINRLHHYNRQRFTLAHELGHFFLHRYRQVSFHDKKFFRGFEVNSMEYEANEFAGALLMPEKKFLELSKSFDDRSLAEYFKVSLQAVEMRKRLLKV